MRAIFLVLIICVAFGLWQWPMRGEGSIQVRSPISACDQGRKWQFAVGLRINFISACGVWQWPLRGIRIGEAKCPGPPKRVQTEEEQRLEEEELFGVQMKA